MEQSILKSTKQLLGVEPSELSFDLDIITQINAAFSTLLQLGIGPEDGFAIEDDSSKWADLELTIPLLSMAKPFVLHTVRLAFDPPGTSFVIEALKSQIAQLEFRMNVYREEVLHPYVAPVQEENNDDF